MDLSQLFQSDIHWNDAAGSLASGRHRNSQYSNTLSATGRPLSQHLRTHGQQVSNDNNDDSKWSK